MSTPLTVTTDNWSSAVMDSAQPVVVDFWAPWCQPCQRLAPVLEEIAADFDGRAVVAKVNVDEERTLGSLWQVMTIPALMFFKDGKKVGEMIGAHKKEAIAEKLESLL
ncbi:thioredoxin [Corynebacterium mendelii]|uniref:Thioredoxin n=1 Tax=Corynebacterium mendelii TaxID=2765362 RepID=A0A939E1Z0_9CORY|nr:thioredoxin [Corynebacterium mendelii]MBN9644298.1 thioredoxin [Corynebacterium mendelii]